MHFLNPHMLFSAQFNITLSKTFFLYVAFVCFNSAAGIIGNPIYYYRERALLASIKVQDVNLMTAVPRLCRPVTV